MAELDRRSFVTSALALAASAACLRSGRGGEDASTTNASASASTSGAASASASASVEAATSASTSAAPAVPDAPYPRTTPKERVANGDLDLHDWELPGDASLANRAVVLVPRHLAKGERVPLLVALHGLAETANPEMGAYAWVRRYGISEGYAHLREPDSISVDALGKMITQARVDELRASLAERRFRGMVIACPYTPNLWKGSVDGVLDAYTRWLFDVLVPRLRAETPVLADGVHLGVDGVSLGGYASLGVGARAWDRLGAIGCVQAALSASEADAWATRFEKARAASGERPLQVLTSTQDVFRASNEALDRALTRRSLPHEFRVAIGPHDQPFLRGPGSLEMLFWQERALRRA
jgi:enterochelin esterase-like enzyme